MKSSAKKVELASVDDLFSTEESRADAQREKVMEIPLSELHPFKDHPFKVKDDEAMMETADSIRQYGVLVPAIARPDPNGGYELVAGHRRHRASELAGKETMPVIVRDLDDDQATIIMVDSNLQRESLLPSERAFAYKMKLEAMKRQAGRPSKENCSQVGNDFGKKSSEVLAEQVGQSKNQIFRYIRLTELIPELLDMVDEKKIAFNPAYELSFLKKEEQVDLLDAMDSEQATPSLSQAQRLKKYSQEGHLTLDMMRVIMGEEKKSDLDKITFTSDTLRNLSNSIMVPIAGVILAIVMTLELIQMITDKNNLHDVDTWMIFKWVFKSAAAILIVSNTWNIVMGVFDAAQSVVAQAAGIIGSDASIDISSVMTDMESRLMDMDLGPLFGLWFQSLFIGITMWALYICIFIVIYGRMIEIYLVTSVAPIPMATMMGKEWGGMGQNYLRSLIALGFQAFLIIVCVAIYAVLVQSIATESDIIMAIWSCVGYTVLLCFTLFKTGSLAKSVFNAH